MTLVSSYSLYGQINRQSDQEINSASIGAAQTHNYANKAHQIENFVDAKSYMQQVLSTAKETKTAIINAEKLLIEQEKQISNSENKDLIENIKDQREEITKAIEEATIACDYAEKASQATDLETLHNYTWEISKASSKVMRQIEATQRYSSLLKDTKTN